MYDAECTPVAEFQQYYFRRIFLPDRVFYDAFQRGLRVGEYLVLFQGRENERSEMSFGVIIEAIIKALSLAFINLPIPCGLAAG